MKFTIIAFVSLLLLVGCGSNLTWSEIELSKATQTERSFFEDLEATNGVHLYYDGDRVYVLLNGRNVMQGEKATHFSDFNVEFDGDILNIYYKEVETEDFSDETLKYLAFYKVNMDKDYDVVQLFRNGIEQHFEVVSVR